MMKALLKAWNGVKSNPIFVSAYSSFVGALGVQLQAVYASGRLDLTLAGGEHMLAFAGITTFWSLVHLYTPKPPASGTPAQ